MIETSSEAARKQVDALYEELVKEMRTNSDGSSSSDDSVNSSGKCLQLETGTCNEADFRKPIVKGQLSVGAPLPTLLDVPNFQFGRAVIQYRTRLDIGLDPPSSCLDQ
jgi:hypothetical protein